VQSGKVVLWALEREPTPYMVEVLSRELGCDVLLVGVGGVERACDLLEALHDTGARTAVVDMESLTEVEKLLERGVELIVPLFEEVRQCRLSAECRWDPLTEIVVDEGDGARVLRFTGYGRADEVVLRVERLGEN